MRSAGHRVGNFFEDFKCFFLLNNSGCAKLPSYSMNSNVHSTFSVADDDVNRSIIAQGDINRLKPCLYTSKYIDIWLRVSQDRHWTRWPAWSLPLHYIIGDAVETYSLRLFMNAVGRGYVNFIMVNPVWSIWLVTPFSGELYSFGQHGQFANWFGLLFSKWAGRFCSRHMQ